MRQRILLIAFAVVGLAPAQPDIAALNRGIVKITTHKPDGTTGKGAGIIVGIDGDTAIIVTAHHVIAEAKTIGAVFFEKQYSEFPAKPFRRFHEDLDLGLLTVAIPHELANHLAQPFPIGDGSDLREGDKLIVIGHPLDLEWQASVNVNTVSGLSEGEDSRRFRLTRTALDRGNSGGGVFRDDGSLLGFLTRLSPNQGYAVAVKVDALLFLLRQEWGIATWWRTDDALAALARELAGYSVATRNEFARVDEPSRDWWAFVLRDPERKALLERSVLLAVESLKRSRTDEGDRALRDALALLPREAFTLSHNERDAAFTLDGRYIVSVDYRREARVWDAATRRELARMRLDDEDHSITLSHDGRYAATAGKRFVELWNVPAGDSVARLSHSEDQRDELLKVVFSPDDRLVACHRRWNNAVQLWALPAGRQVGQLEHAGPVRSVSFSPDGRAIVTTSGADGAEEQRSAWVWSAESVRRKTRLEHRDDVAAVAFSPDGKYLATADGSTLRIWNPSEYSRLLSMETANYINALRFSPDSRRLLVGWSTGSLHGADLYEAGTWKLLGSAKGGALTASAFTRNGTNVALLGFDSASRVWNIETRREIARLVNTEGNVRTVVSGFSPDGEYAVTEGNSSSPLKLWPLTIRDPVGAACARVGRNLTPDEWKRYLGRVPYRRTCDNLW